ncbi:MAG: non-homologous end-joining DNA ligase [Roseburia sp.]|nr:non-homologous end-joining DNA ligase [Roseburia sp.]
MADLFKEKNISPMLLHEVKEPFDDKDYIHELKLDGIRCIAYIEPKSVTLQNKRFKDLTSIYPELADICKCVKKRVILDGELVVLNENGKPDFYALQRRSLMSDSFKISLAAKRNPVQFVAYDILYHNGKELIDYELMKRKEILSKSVQEGHNLSISRFIEEKGVAFFELAKKENLEGIVSKKKDGLYHIGKRTHDWIKVKVMQDEDLLVLGYEPDEDGNVKDLVLGYYDDNRELKCRGKVYLGVSKTEQRIIGEFAKKNTVKKPWFEKYKNVVWLKPQLVGTAHFMHETENGGMRQPVWKGLRDDK